MTTTPAPEPTTPAKARATRKPTKSGDPRADRAAATKKAAAATARAAKAATPKAKPVTKKAAPITTEKGWQIALSRNQAVAAYCKHRTLLHGAGPEAYRKAAAKALDISDEVFEAAFYKAKAPKTAPKAEPEGK